MRGAIALLLAAFAATAPGRLQAGHPAPFERHYEVLRNGQPLGEATIALRHVEGATFELVTRTRGTRGLAGLAGAATEEWSRFVWREGHPELLRYRYRQDVAFRTRERSLDRAPGDRIESRDGERRHDLAFEPGTLDRHIVVLALGADLARGAVGTLRYRVADRDDVEWQRYRVAGVERVGGFDAVRVERVRDNPGRSTSSWLAPALGYAPVRIVQREADGETIELRLLAR